MDWVGYNAGPIFQDVTVVTLLLVAFVWICLRLYDELEDYARRKRRDRRRWW